MGSFFAESQDYFFHRSEVTGGSFEDLFAFSDERVVRALAASRIPTVSAIGHEADAPLTDFVADFRAATPSAAAQTILPRREDLLRLIAERRRVLTRDVERLVAARRQTIDVTARHLTAAARERLTRRRDRLLGLERRLGSVAPAARLARWRGRYEQLRDRLERALPALVRVRASRIAATPPRLDAAMSRVLERRTARLTTIEAQLEGNNPTAILQRGYAIVRDEDGRLVRDAAEAPPGSVITAELARGSLTARVEREGTDGGRQISLF